ncbi:MAG: SdpI family protein [Anaerolineae bacterium]|nr:SdpI family protein [Anaerolineae bacterium]
MSVKGLPTVVVGVMLLISLMLYPSLPDQVPVHWSIQGKPDSFAPKALAVLLLPALTLILLLVGRLSMTRIAFERRYGEARETQRFMINAIVVFLGFMHALMLVTALNPDVPLARVYVIGLGGLCVALGNVMGRLRPNPLFGIRFPWTLSDETVWRRTHRVGGRWLFMSGLVLMLATLVLSPESIFVLALGLLLGGAVCLAYASRALWLERHSERHRGV